MRQTTTPTIPATIPIAEALLLFFDLSSPSLLFLSFEEVLFLSVEEDLPAAVASLALVLDGAPAASPTPVTATAGLGPAGANWSVVPIAWSRNCAACTSAHVPVAWPSLLDMTGMITGYCSPPDIIVPDTLPPSSSAIPI